MAAASYQISLGAAALRLSDVYGDGAGVANPMKDIPYRQIILSSQVDVTYLGAASDTSATKYGTLIASNATVPPVSIGPYEKGPVKLSDFWAAGGVGAILHILGVPY